MTSVTPMRYTRPMLSGYRVLDLTDERGQLAGQTLSDLGAEVVLIEPPGGSRSRRIGPFVDGHEGDPENSLWFWSYNRGKRSVVLDLGLHPGGTGGDSARFPRDGSTFSLNAEGNGGLDVVVVPIQYNADGSGRVPDTSAAAMNALREHMLALFPVSEVRLTVREPLPTNISISGSRLTALTKARVEPFTTGSGTRMSSTTVNSLSRNGMSIWTLTASSTSSNDRSRPSGAGWFPKTSPPWRSTWPAKRPAW